MRWAGASVPERVIYVVRSWPRLSQTFIVNEVLALERRGLELAIFSLVRSGEDRGPAAGGGRAGPVHYLDGTARRACRRTPAAVLVRVRAAAPFLRALLHCLLHPGWPPATASAPRCRASATPLRVAAAVRDLRAAGDEPVHVHAHFAHDPALVGMLVAGSRGLPFSFTAHARDLLQIPAGRAWRPGRGRRRPW